jgi:hypothetical protein
MSGGQVCCCRGYRLAKSKDDKKYWQQKYWRVTDFRCNHSAFNGYHWTASDYSAVTCLCCGRFWRTKADYADVVLIIKGNELKRPLGPEPGDEEKGKAAEAFAAGT